MQRQQTKKQGKQSQKNKSVKGEQNAVNGAGVFSRSLYRKDPFEDQADKAAAGIIRGRENVARLLSPVPAASFKVRTSTGHPLPVNLRTDLEEGFGADLGDVRVHDNAAAAAAARTHNARAFVSGRDIYFASGAFNPGSDYGREILAHEVAHVLQQTGRSHHSGHMRATDIQGPGDIQYNRNFNQIRLLYREIPLHITGEQLHTEEGTEAVTESEQEESFVRIENAIRRVLGLEWELTPPQGESRLAGELNSRVLEGQYDDEVTGAKSLLFDVLKIWQRYDGAAYLIHRDPDIMTRFHPDDAFITYLRENNMESVDELLRGDHPEFHNKWPFNLTSGLWHVLINLDVHLPEISNGYPGDENAVWSDYLSTEPGFAHNERFILAREIMLWSDHLRLETIGAAAVDFTEHFNELTGIERWGNLYMSRRIFEILSSPAEGENEVSRGARIAMRNIARDARLYWNQVFSLDIGLQEGATERARLLVYNTRSLEDMEDYPGGEVPANPVLEEYIRVIEHHTREVFTIPTPGETPETDVPPPAPGRIPHVLNQTAYAEKITAFRQAIESWPQRLAEQAVRVFRYRDREEPQTAGLARWLGWCQIWEIFTLRPSLHLYNALEDRATGNDEYRLRHRLDLALILYQFGLAFNNSGIITTVEALFQARDVGRSYILLTDEWDSSASDINQLTDDISAQRIIENWGITAEQLVLFYHLLYQSDIATRLSMAFEESPGQDVDEPAHERHAAQMVQRYNMVMNPERHGDIFPVRYNNPGAITNYSPDDTLTMSQLLSGREEDHSDENPHFTRFLEEHVSGESFYITPLGRRPEPVIWVLPPIGDLVRVLRGIALLRNLVPETITDDRLWILHLGRTVAELTETDRTSLSRQVREVYTTFVTSSFSWRRRYITEDVRNRLYVAARHRGEIEHYTDMTDTLGIIRNFSFRIRPVETTEAQMTIMILDIADELRTALLDDPSWFENLIGIGTRVDTRYNVITGYYGIIQHALNYLSGENGPETISHLVVEGVEHREGETETTYQGRLERLQTARTQALMAKQGVLAGILEQLSSAITELQLRGRGFEAERGEGVRSFNYSVQLPLREEMFYQGKTYLIDEIFTDFIYFPPYGMETEAAHPSILFLISGSEQTRHNRRTRTRLFRYTEDNREFIAHTNQGDDRHLNLMSNVVEEAAFFQTMANLGTALEDATELTLDLIELIPGFGQGVMIARMVMEMTRFSIEELPQILEAFNNPEQMFRDLLDWFNQTNWIERIVEYLIFRADTFTLPGSLTSNTEDTGRSRRRRHSGLDRIIRALKTLGEKIFNAFQLLQRRVRGGIVQAQSRLVEYRTLTRILEFIPGLVLTAMDLAAIARQRIDRTGLELSPGELIATLLGEGENIQTKIQEVIGHIVRGLHDFELPESIIPMDSIVDVLIGFALDRFGRKGRILNDLMGAIGARTRLAEVISRYMVEGTNIDINLYWRTNFRGPLQEKLIGLQNYIIDEELNPLIRTTLGPAYLINNSSLGEPHLTTAPETPAETEAYPRDREKSEEEEFSIPELTRGSVLQNRQKRELEGQFGHDLGHVRLHHDKNADDFTRGLGAYALTTGSHIFLAGDVALHSFHGKHILRHEIAHVLQQTGDRPLTEKHDPRPHPGNPGRGLRRENHRENAAEDMAKKAGQTYKRVPIEEEGGEGLYPNYRRFSIRLLNYLSDTQVSEQVAEDLEDRIPAMSADERSSFNTAKSEARGLWRQVIQRIRTGTTGIDFDGPYRHGRDLIGAAIQTLYDSGEAINSLTFRSVRQLPSGQYTLREERFLGQLRTYIYGSTGIVLVFTVIGNELRNVRVSFIHLGNTPGNLAIWTNEPGGVKKVTENAFPRHRDMLRRNWPRIRNYLHSLDYSTRNVWDSTAFRLHSDFVTEVEERFRDTPEDNVELGTWDDYTTPTFTSGGRNVGLRVGTHGQLTAQAHSTPPPSSTRDLPASSEYRRFNLSQNIHDAAKTGRESHHIPQYLLVEYFRNEASTSMFPSATERLPGFSSGTNWLESFNGGPGKQIDLAALDPGGNSNRGLNLPAVLIARRTHQRGQLHINQAFDWSTNKEGHGTRTQSAWMDYFFYSQLGRVIPNVSENSPKTEIIDQVRGMTNQDQAKTAVYNAMKATYNRVYSNMIDVLHPGLNNHEIPYYRDMALRTTGTTGSDGELTRNYTPTESGLSETENAIEALNQRIMWQWR